VEYIISDNHKVFSTFATFQSHHPPSHPPYLSLSSLVLTPGGATDNPFNAPWNRDVQPSNK